MRCCLSNVASYTTARGGRASFLGLVSKESWRLPVWVFQMSIRLEGVPVIKYRPSSLKRALEKIN